MLLAAIVGCSSPASDVRGDDLMGVFDADAGTKAGQPAGSAKPHGSASAAPSSSAALAAASASALALAPLPPRTPESERCVEVSGTPASATSRTMGRPACRGAEVLEWRDAGGAPRYACFFSAPDEVKGPAPLVVFFPGNGPTLDAPTAVHKQTSLRTLQGKTPLGGSKGFHILAIQGRVLPGTGTATFDTGFVSPDNVDVATATHFVEVLEDRKLVDRRRIYALGIGPGGTMAATWAMLAADRVAAFATFAGDPPVAAWTCPGPPPPGTVIYRACDAITSCDGIERFLEGRERARAETRAFRLGDDAKEVSNCEPRNSCGNKRGTAAHHRWTKALEKPILAFFGAHELALPP
jgi:poly(3-hydroxybutyrate) depolymerase